MNVSNFRSDLVDASGLHAKALVRGQRLTRNFEQNTFEGRGCCGGSHDWQSLKRDYVIILRWEMLRCARTFLR